MNSAFSIALLSIYLCSACFAQQIPSASSNAETPPKPGTAAQGENLVRFLALIGIWSQLMERIAGDKPDAASMAAIAAKLAELSDASNRLLTQRAQAFERESLAPWKKALERATSDKAAGWQTLLLLIHQDSMFKEGTIHEDRASLQLARLTQLPPAAVEQWTKMTRREKKDAAMNLIATDAAFKNDAFDEALFQALCLKINPKP